MVTFAFMKCNLLSHNKLRLKCSYRMAVRLPPSMIQMKIFLNDGWGQTDKPLPIGDSRTMYNGPTTVLPKNMTFGNNVVKSTNSAEIIFP